MIRRILKRRVGRPLTGIPSTSFADNPQGSFGVPIELLVERDGADSLLGASRATLRVPSFIDDVISAMKQMGKQYVVCAMMYKPPQTSPTRYVRRGYIQEKREHSQAQGAH
jgi:hypothetical protein